MLATLIESKRTRSRNRGATAVSVIVHALVIILAAAVTAHASDGMSAARPKPPDVIYVEPPQHVQPEQHPSAPSHPETPSQPEIPRLPYPIVDMPKTIPTDLPPVNPSLPPVDPGQFAIGPRSNDNNPGAGRATSRSGSGTFTAWEVEKAVIPLSGNPKPAYPSMLQSAHVDGEVLAQFVVDTTGRVDMSTFRAIQATNELFVQSVRRALSEWKFRPAEAGGVKVKQLVQMPLTFKVR
ncbi:MAG TPA: TonB family protein [Gemmatimonadaceae bacterium]|jgi:protein TonB|nr:TonB family protein [Gemmatimonadaceae bacterium]